MAQNILSDIGENYEYARTILSKKLELYKIELSEKLGEIIGVLIFIFLGILVLNLIFLGLLIVLGIWLSQLIGSVYLGILIVLLLLGLTFYLIIAYRKVLIIRPIISLLVNIITKTKNHD